MRDKHVTIRDDQADWVESNDAVNLSGLVRDAIDEARDG
jgi:hypothetical protein